MPLIRDLIEIPERVYEGDFVLTLTAGLDAAEATLGNYVVTPELARSFADAMGFVKDAVVGRRSKAAYLHGSFGSGKSHFMAVLHLLLSGNQRARSIPDLSRVVADSNDWTRDRTFLLVPYHMIGARDMESAILGGYAAHVRALHPEAPAPGFFQSEHLFADAGSLRARMGDDGFFQMLNGGGSGDAGWGDFGAAWTPERFAAAIGAPPTDPDRANLVATLVGRVFSAYARSTSASDDAFLSLDEGLSILSRHARDLGYDAVILFLDELILWLATHMADIAFISREGPKLSKLVEAQAHDRPVPIISFVARQRDLRDFIGDHVAGAHQVAIADSLKWWEARFHRITLNDSNLPAVAEKRLLAPRDTAARAAIDAAFAQTMKLRQDLLDTLQTAEADAAMFRQVYPFSPALVETLIAVSSVLQRQRTALRLMLQLLVAGRDTLEAGEIVPVGDLWDVIAEGVEPFDSGMQRLFDDARRLYDRKLLPLLKAEHGVPGAAGAEGTGTAGMGGFADPRAATAFRDDARLLKTLLLAALVPEVTSLKALTAQRLAALNHGSIRTPIAGTEARIVLTKLRGWAAQVGEIKIGPESANPVISIQISSVDTETILANAQLQDNPGNRRRMIRTLMFEALRLRESNDLFATCTVTWRGTERSVRVVYENVREMAESGLTARGNEWLAVIDFPFDEPGHFAMDDVSKLDSYRASHQQGCRTLVWLPNFFSDALRADLGTLVSLDHILTGSRFAEYARHLSPTDRNQAETLLTNQRDQLRQRVRDALLVAYGVASQPANAVTPGLEADQHFQTLHDTLTLRPPVGADIRDAFEGLLDQAFAHEFPAHPDFSEPVKLGEVRKVWEEVQATLATPDRRRPIERTMRPLMARIAQALRIGGMGDTHFVASEFWRQHFQREHDKAGMHPTAGMPPTVGMLRRWIDTPRAMGLPKHLQNLIILAYAEQTDQVFQHQGTVVPGGLQDLPDDLDLRSGDLPDETAWTTAHRRAQAIFGLAPPALRNAGTVGRLAAEITSEVKKYRAPVAAVPGTLAALLRRYALDPARADRLRTARAVATLVKALEGKDGKALIEALAAAGVATSEGAMGEAVKQAAAQQLLLTSDDWTLFERLRGITDQRAAAAAPILDELATALAADEHVTPLGDSVRRAKARAVDVLATPLHPPDKASRGRRMIDQGTSPHLAPAAARLLFGELTDALDQGPGRSVTITWSIEAPEDGA